MKEDMIKVDMDLGMTGKATMEPIKMEIRGVRGW